MSLLKENKSEVSRSYFRILLTITIINALVIKANDYRPYALPYYSLSVQLGLFGLIYVSRVAQSKSLICFKVQSVAGN